MFLFFFRYTYGKQPYEGMEAHQLLKFLERGLRLDMPPTASDEVQQEILACWEKEPNHRPKFRELLNFFRENREYSNLKELLINQDLGALATADNAARITCYDKPDTDNPPASTKVKKPNVLI